MSSKGSVAKNILSAFYSGNEPKIATISCVASEYLQQSQGKIVDSIVKPLFLLADSQLLFWRRCDIPFLNSVRDVIDVSSPKAAYIGASNADNLEYYSIFEAAMEMIGIHRCRMAPSSPTAEDFSFLNDADIILLAGGDPVRGWRVFEETGLRELIVDRYLNGAVLIGVSAGAMQIGLYAWPEGAQSEDLLIRTFGLVPFIVGVHDEKNEWHDIRQVLNMTKSGFPAIGIPSGGGLIYHPDHSIEPVHKTLYEFALEDEHIKVNILEAS
jgi:Peptidase family S51